MFTGLTLANVLGVPIGTWLGQLYGWRATFWASRYLASWGLSPWCPACRRDVAPANLAREFAALRNGRLLLSLLMTVCFAAAMFTLFSYIAPLLLQVTGVSDRGVSWTLFLIGGGLTLGNLIGGRLADWRLSLSLMLSFALIAVFSVMFYWTSRALLPAEMTLFFWALATFSIVPALQINVVAHGGDAPNLVSTLNISAFNIGNALGAWAGGKVIASGLGLATVPLAAAAMALCGLLVCLLTFSRSSGRPVTA